MSRYNCLKHVQHFCSHGSNKRKGKNKDKILSLQIFEPWSIFETFSKIKEHKLTNY